MISFQDYFKNFRYFGLEYFKKYYAQYRGIVFDNADPENRGRLQIQVAGIYDEPYKYWASPKGNYSGNGTGFFFIPQKNDNVWVSFEQGDPRFPIWEYGFWSNEQTPTEATLKNKVLKTESGNLLEFDDEGELVRFTSAKGKVIELSDKISLGSKDGSKEAAILGDTLKGKLDSLFGILDSVITQIQLINVASFGTPPTNAPAFIPLQTQLSTLKGTLDKILSEIVTLD